MSQDRVGPAFLLVVTLAVGTGMANASENCFYDIDDDGSVGAGDLSLLLGAWGGGSLEADLDGSGLVDAGDLALLLGTWGPCPEESACYAGSQIGYVSYVGAASDATDPGALIVPEDAAFAFDGQATCPDDSAGILAGGFPDNVTVLYAPYQVGGATFSEARAAIFGTDGSGPGGLGVIGADGIQYAGYTAQRTSILPGCIDFQASNETLFTVYGITYVITIQYPVWNAPVDASAEDLAHWATLESRLLNHEREHVQVLRDWQTQILLEAWGHFDSMDGIHLYTGASGHCPEYHGGTLIPGTESTAKLFVQDALNQVYAGNAWANMKLAQKLLDDITNHGDVFAGLPE